MEYNYSLRGGSRKDICPQCGKLSYKPYVNTAGEEFAPGVGRCDRAHKCRYHYPPSEWFRDHRPAATPRDRNTGIASQPAKEAPVIKAPDYIDPRDLQPSLRGYERNPLINFLSERFAAWLSRDRVENIARMMGVGTSRQFGGSTVFWQIDRQGAIRDGKIMGYDRQTGKRIKHPRPLFTNVHTMLREKYTGRYKGCWFGSHLVREREYDNREIWLFESEKAALIFAMLFEAGGLMLALPMAAGGCSAFNPTDENLRDPYNGLQVLAGRRVVLFPDEGKYDEWQLKGRALRNFCSSVRISDIMEKPRRGEIECEIEEGDGFDDIILRYLAAGKNPFDIMLKC